MMERWNNGGITTRRAKRTARQEGMKEERRERAPISTPNRTSRYLEDCETGVRPLYDFCVLSVHTMATLEL